jgi:hypothetical protein
MRLNIPPLAFILFLQFFSIVHSAGTETAEEVAVNNFFYRNHNATVSAHTNNWAVLVCASRYWFNYRVRSIDPHHMLFAHPKIADSIWRMHWECTFLSSSE